MTMNVISSTLRKEPRHFLWVIKESSGVLSLKWGEYYKRVKARLIHRKHKHLTQKADIIRHGLGKLYSFFIYLFYLILTFSDILGVLAVQAMTTQASTCFLSSVYPASLCDKQALIKTVEDRTWVLCGRVCTHIRGRPQAAEPRTCRKNIHQSEPGLDVVM